MSSYFSENFTQDFFTSRRNFEDGNTRIGDFGRLWYDSITNTIRISDGSTPGGIIVSASSTGGGSGYSGFSGYQPWIVISETYQASNSDKIIANSENGIFTINLPATPNIGDYIIITDGYNFNLNNVIIDPGSYTIENYSDTVALDMHGVTFEFIYDGNTWQVTGTTGASGTSGLSGYSGYSGASGYIGISGYSGLSGADGDNRLIWDVNGSYRTLTAFKDDNNTITTVRSADFFNDLLRLTLASFTPTLNAVATPGSTLNWDVPVTGFNVIVNNPDDILVEYISDVDSLTLISGDISSIELFTASSPSQTPAPTIDWNQNFATNINSYIRSTSTSISGGSASALINFNYWNGNEFVNYVDNNTTLSVTWATPTLSVTLNSLTGNTFLQSYISVAYTVVVTGISYSANYSHSVTAIGGSVSNVTGSGTFTFDDPINKNNVLVSRTVTSETNFTRPEQVTGSNYSAILTYTSSNPSATFSYPSLWVFTSSVFAVPVRTTFVDGDQFQTVVTQLGNQVKTFSSYVTNTQLIPQAFWFAIRSSASQPTVFKTGASPALLSDVAVTIGNSVDLQPDIPPLGYIAENYTLYGITLQPGSTYVSIL